VFCDVPLRKEKKKNFFFFFLSNLLFTPPPIPSPQNIFSTGWKLLIREETPLALRPPFPQLDTFFLPFSSLIVELVLLPSISIWVSLLNKNNAKKKKNWTAICEYIYIHLLLVQFICRYCQKSFLKIFFIYIKKTVV